MYRTRSDALACTHCKQSLDESIAMMTPAGEWVCRPCHARATIETNESAQALAKLKTKRFGAWMVPMILGVFVLTASLFVVLGSGDEGISALGAGTYIRLFVAAALIMGSVTMRMQRAVLAVKAKKRFGA
jgi:hypothetical protein